MPDSPASDAPAPAVASPAAHAGAARASAPWLLGLALVLAAGGIALAASLWQRLGAMQQELARRAADSAAQAEDAVKRAQQAEALAQELQARLGVAELRLSEVSLQRSQLEELMLSVSRSRDDSLVQDLESSLRLAAQQAQVSGSAQPLVSALQAAEQRIARAAQPRLNPVQRAIGRDIERLRSSALLDVPALTARLDELIRAVDGLPLANAVGVRRPALAAGSASGPGVAGGAGGAGDAAAPPVKGKGSAKPAKSEIAATAADPVWAAWGDSLQRWGDAWWESVKARGNQLLRLSRIDQPEALLLAPEEAYLLRENLKLKLLNARMALLSRQMVTARADMATVAAAVRRYAQPDAGETEYLLQALQQMQADTRRGDLPRADDTLTALAAAARGR